MFRKIVNSILYALLITGLYVIASNIGYYYINSRTMFADVYFYEWVEYLIVAIIMLICTALIELVRNLLKKEEKTEEITAE